MGSSLSMQADSGGQDCKDGWWVNRKRFDLQNMSRVLQSCLQEAPEGFWASRNRMNMRPQK